MCVLKSNKFVNASFFSAISSFTKIVSSLILGKIIAMKLGAEGMALFGQLLSFVTVVLVMAGGAINQGVIKYVAEFNLTDDIKLKNLLSTSFRITIYSSFLIGLILIIASKYLAAEILHNRNYSSIFVLFGVTLAFNGLNNLFLSILNGYKEFKKNNIINIILNLISLLFSLYFIYLHDIFGVLLSVVINQSSIFFLTLYLLRNESWMSKEFLFRKIDFKLLKQISSFALLSIASTALTPFISIILRNYIIDALSIQQAGLFEFVNRVASTSIMFFSLTISTYYLPRISEIRNKNELMNEVKNTYKVIMPFLIFMLILVYLLRFIIIKILASESFSPSAHLFSYYLLGVFFKILSQLLSFIFIAKAKIKIALLLEVFFNLFYVVLSVCFINVFGLLGTAYVFLLSYVLYFIILIYLFNKLLEKYYDT